MVTCPDFAGWKSGFSSLRLLAFSCQLVMQVIRRAQGRTELRQGDSAPTVHSQRAGHAIADVVGCTI